MATPQHDLFSEDQTTKGMARHDDTATSKAAAAAVAVHLNNLQIAVLESFRTHGHMSARQVERRFPEYGFSTVRKRVSELNQMGLILPTGTETVSGKSPCTVYVAAPR